MPDHASVAYPPPKNWQDFERCCRKLFECILADPLTELNGVSGQRQNGVDIFGRRGGIVSGKWVGVQCKGKAAGYGAKVTTRELRREVEQALRFVPALSEFILVTTAKGDSTIGEAARKLEDELQARGYKMKVTVWGWGRLEEEIVRYPAVLREFHPDATPFTDNIIAGQQSLADMLSQLLAQATPPRSSADRLASRIDTGETVIERVDLSRFSGREWLSQRIDDFIERNDRGYMVIEAAAGLGKTTFLANFAVSRDLPRHFVEIMPGSAGIDPGLRNLAAQIALRAGNRLEGSWVDRIVGTQPFHAHDFAALLRAVASTDTPLTIVIDALDEAGSLDGLNLLGLPNELPKGAYILVSLRPGYGVKTKGPRLVERIEAQSDVNQADVSRFLEHIARQAPFQAMLSDPSAATSANFVRTLGAKSRGVWVYLHYVLGEIERGEKGLSDIGTLPIGLDQYYADWVLRWRDSDERAWDDERLPLLSSLAVMREPVTLDVICKIAGLVVTERLRRLLDGRWRSFFVTTEDKDGNRLYAAYHASFSEFMKAGPSDSDEQARRQLAEEMKRSIGNAQQRTCDLLLGIWGDVSNRLPVPLDPSDGGIAAYGRRHLVAHLLVAGRRTNAEELILSETTDETGRRVNLWHWVRSSFNELSGFMDDTRLVFRSMLRRVGRYATDPAIMLLYRTFSPIDAVGSQMGRAVLAALNLSSINSLASSTPPELFPVLVRTGIWTLQEACDQARRIPYEFPRAIALAAVADVAGIARDVLVGEATRIAFQMTDHDGSVLALAILAKYQPQDRAEMIRAHVMREIEQMQPRFVLPPLNELAPDLSEEVRNDALLRLVRWPDAERPTLAFFQSLAWATGEAREQVIDRLREELKWRSIGPFCHHLLSVTLPFLDEAEQCSVLRSGEVSRWLSWNPLPIHPTMALELWGDITVSPNDDAAVALTHLAQSLTVDDAEQTLRHMPEHNRQLHYGDRETAVRAALLEQSTIGHAQDDNHVERGSEAHLLSLLIEAESAKEPWERASMMGEIKREITACSDLSAGFVRRLQSACYEFDDGNDAMHALCSFGDGLEPADYRRLMTSLNQDMLREEAYFEHPEENLARLAVYLRSSGRRRYLETVVGTHPPELMPAEAIGGIILLARTVPPRFTKRAWSVAMEALEHGEFIADVSFQNLVFRLSSSLRPREAAALLGHIARKEDARTQALALWALGSSLDATALETAWSLAQNLDEDGPALLAQASIAAASKFPARLLDMRRKIERTEDDNAFLTVSIATLLAAIDPNDRSALLRCLGDRLERYEDHYRFSIFAHVQMARFSDDVKRLDNWRKAFTLAARERLSLPVVHWLAKQAPMSWTESHELEATCAAIEALSFAERSHAFDLLEAIEPMIRQRADRAMICQAIMTVQRWWS